MKVFDIEDYIRGLSWSAAATDQEKTLVAANLRALYHKLLGINDADLEAVAVALRATRKGLDTWTCIHASDMCGEEAAREAQRLIMEAGTLSYIADLNGIAREALSRPGVVALLEGGTK